CRMRRAMFVAIPAMVMLLAAAGIPLRAEDGTLTVKVLRATANASGKDDWTNPQQDFFVRYCIDNEPEAATEKVSDKDDTSFSRFTTTSKFVPMKNQRFFDLYFELWDDDTCPLCGGNPQDDFDISPQNGPPPLPFLVMTPSIPTGGFPHVQYDVCTGQMYV